MRAERGSTAGEHGVHRRVGPQLPGQQEVDEAQGHEHQKYQADQGIEPGHGHQADRGQCQGDGRHQRVARGAEAAWQIRFRPAQFEQAEHAHDVHHDGTEHRHGDHGGSEGHAAKVDQAIAVDGGDADQAAGDDRPMWRLKARQPGQGGRQVTGPGQGEELARVAENDPVETCHQAEQADPYQHVQPAGTVTHNGLHRLGQRVVDVRQAAPVPHAAGEEHHPHGQQHQGQDAADIGFGNGALGVLGFFGSHGRAFDGQEKPDGEGNGGEHPGNCRGAEGVGACPAVEGEVAEAEGWGHHAHEHQEFGHRQHADHQFKGGCQFHPENVQAHEYDVGANRGMFRIQGRELHVQVSADGQGDGGRGEDEFDQGGQPRDQAAFFTKGATAVGKRAAGVGNRCGQLGETEYKAGIHGRHHQRGHEKPQGSCHAPAIAPAEVLSGNHQSDCDAP